MSSETITRNDLTNILNEVLPSASIGKVYTADWTANSSNNYGLRMTDTMTLPKGTYVVVMKIPYVASGTFGGAQLFYGSGTLLDSRSICVVGSQQVATVIISLYAEFTIYIATAGSASCTFNYLERGGLVAIKIG